MKEHILFYILQLDIYGIYPSFAINGEKNLINILVDLWQ